MNKQEIFDKVKEHLLKQDACSETDDDCAYRGKDGLKCAIGILIPDSLYEKSMESSSIKGVLDCYPDVKDYIDPDGENIELLTDLQVIHDNGYPCEWEEKLTECANTFGLNH